MDHDAREVFGTEIAGKSFHGDEAKAVECEMGLEDFPTASAEYVLVGLPGVAKILGVEVAVLVQHLRMREGRFRSRRPVYLQAQPSHHVLRHTRDGSPGRRLSRSA